MNAPSDSYAGKVPAVTLAFWVIKIAATTLGETGGDAVTMSMNLGYLIVTLIFAVLFLIAVAAQIRAKKFHPFLYWAVIIATTTTGTTLADFADRSLGIGYAGGSTLLLALLLVTFAVWYWTQVQSPLVQSPHRKLGFGGGALVFGAGLALVAAAYWWTTLSHTALFWIAFVLTRPLGATIGDLLDKPHEEGGFALSRYAASAVLAVFIVACIALLPQRPIARASAS